MTKKDGWELLLQDVAQEIKKEFQGQYLKNKKLLKEEFRNEKKALRISYLENKRLSMEDICRKKKILRSFRREKERQELKAARLAKSREKVANGLAKFKAASDKCFLHYGILDEKEKAELEVLVRGGGAEIRYRLKRILAKSKENKQNEKETAKLKEAGII